MPNIDSWLNANGNRSASLKWAGGQFGCTLWQIYAEAPAVNGRGDTLAGAVEASGRLIGLGEQVAGGGSELALLQPWLEADPERYAYIQRRPDSLTGCGLWADGEGVLGIGATIAEAVRAALAAIPILAARTALREHIATGAAV